VAHRGRARRLVISSGRTRDYAGLVAENPHAEHLQELLEGLNEPQREAVTHGEGPLLILAGAGSGKTRVLTHRIAFLIYTDQAQASEILAITFTNKAAQEMRGRVERLLGHGTRSMWLMTFHSACARILRADGERLGYTRQFTIYDQADARRLVKRCIEELGVDPKRYAPAAIHSRISDAKNRLRDAAAQREQGGGHFEEIVADAYQLYERELHRANAMDFDDLLYRTVNLLELFEAVRERYAQSFRHVLVDEYQDTNHAQYRLLQLLVGGGRDEPVQGERASLPGHRNLAVVGDDSQSVYGFRGADIRNILDFQEDFPDARVVKLEQNYRSTQTILSAANAVISNNRGGIAKRLWSELGEGDPIEVRALEDEHAEARHVVGEIERLLDEGGANRSEIAIFYRTNAMSRVLEDTLVRREIAYQVIGGTKFYERAEIKDAIAYLSLLANPQDAVSFARVVNSPRRGIGQTSVGRILGHAQTIDVSVWDAAAGAEDVPGLGPVVRRALARLMDTMAELRTDSASGGPQAGGPQSSGPGASDSAPGGGGPQSIADLLEAVLSRTGYLEALENERTIEAQGRIENLEQLVEVGREFDASAEPAEDTLDVFLAQIALVADADSRREDESLVTLMTLHNAKGLEYPIVFVVGCEDGVFPHSRALDEGGLEEERRLFYVGVTRAMRSLHLTYARRRALFGAQTYGLPSRFLGEIPVELTDGRADRLAGAGPIDGGRESMRWAADIGGEVRAAVGRRTDRRSAYDRLDPRPGARDRPGSARLAAHDRSGSARPGAWTAAAHASQTPAEVFRLGEDVVHPAFGEGVVTGLEPDGIIVVRFAGDGSERKLVSELAPVSRL
jgi:DNA helicase II / ATP-dependent DNA helicase PcrA